MFNTTPEENVMGLLTPEKVANLSESQKINVQIIQSLNSVNTAVNDLRHDVNIHDKLLVTGNGEPSLQERLRNVESYVNGAKYWSRFIGGAVVVQTLSIFVGIIIALIKLLPVLEKIASSP